LLGGTDTSTLAPLRSVSSAGFETTIAVSDAPPVLVVQALDAHGGVIGAARVSAAPRG
jgi:hypothetical protein